MARQACTDAGRTGLLAEECSLIWWILLPLLLLMGKVVKDINMSANLIFNTGWNPGAKVSHWTNKVANYESRLSSEVEDTCTTE